MKVGISERLAFTPPEFAALCGRDSTWGYRRIYDGSVKVISGNGRLLIPRKEIQRFFANAQTYQPKQRRNQ